MPTSISAGEDIYINAPHDNPDVDIGENIPSLRDVQLKFETFLRTYYKEASGQQDYG